MILLKYYSIGQFAKEIGKTTKTLRNWDKEGKLKPARVEQSGYRYYSQEQLNHFLGLKQEHQRQKKIIGYCRVSSVKQKDDLERQIEYVKLYMYAKGYSFEIITDIGSGINYNKKGLHQLLDMVISSEVEKIVVLYKDRLLRYGFELVEYFAKLNNVKIRVLDKINKTEDEELVEDLVQIITEFSCKIQGKRKAKTKRILEEIKEKIEEI